MSEICYNSDQEQQGAKRSMVPKPAPPQAMPKQSGVSKPWTPKIAGKKTGKK